MPAAEAAASEALAVMEKLACESMKERTAAAPATEEVTKEPEKEEAMENREEEAEEEADEADAFPFRGVRGDGGASAGFVVFSSPLSRCSAAALAASAPFHGVSRENACSFARLKDSRVSLTVI